MYTPVFPSLKTNAVYFFETESRKKDRYITRIMSGMVSMSILLVAGFAPI